VTYDGKLRYRPNSRIELTVDLARAAKPTNRVNTTYTTSDSESIQLNYLLRPGWNFIAGYSHEQDHDYGVDLQPGVDLTSEDFNTWYLTTTYQFARRLYATLDTHVENRVSDLSQYDYTSVQVGLTVGAHF
jgi:hypothetical protein